MALGDQITIVSNGFESLTPDEIGNEMNFLDINKTLKEGRFGINPKTWGDNEWSMLINYVSAGIEFAEGDWDSPDWAPQIWSTLETKKTRATPATRVQIADLKKRAQQKDEYIEFMCSMPSFMASDALSTITESTRKDDDGGVGRKFREVRKRRVEQCAVRVNLCH